METTTLPIGQPSSQPTGAPSRHLPLNQTDLPKLFLYAGLAGLLTAFVICIIRVFVNHFYLCNYKMYTTGTESTIEIIREADIQIPDGDVHHATVVSCLSGNPDSLLFETKGVRDDTRDKNEGAICSTRSISLLSTDSNALTSIMPASDADAASGSHGAYSGGNGRFNFSNSGAQSITMGIPIAATTARTMNVMESVPAPVSSNTGEKEKLYRALDRCLLISLFSFSTSQLLHLFITLFNFLLTSIPLPSVSFSMFCTELLSLLPVAREEFIVSKSFDFRDAFSEKTETTDGR